MKLNELRREIDTLDKQMISLIGKRFELVEQVAKYKKANGFDALQPQRWQEVLATRKMQASSYGIYEEMIEKIWNTLHEYAIMQEEEIIRN